MTLTTSSSLESYKRSLSGALAAESILKKKIRRLVSSPWKHVTFIVYSMGVQLPVPLGRTKAGITPGSADDRDA